MVTVHLTQCLQVALRHAKAAPTVAMSYLSIVCGLAGGYVLFGEVPTLSAMCGAVLICIATVLVAVFER